MKKPISMMLAVFLVLSLFSGLPMGVLKANAESVTENGIVFETSTGTITDYTGSAETLIIPSTINGVAVTNIGDYAFYQCYSLTSVTIPDSVTVIGIYAFYSCNSLTSITIPDSVTVISSNAFNSCYSLTSVTIPNSVTVIDDYTFCYCYSLTSITIPDSVTVIGEQAFRSCTSLTSVTIPDSVTSIGDGAFSECSSLTSVTIPDSVTVIDDYTFSYCDSLTSITIPNSVTSIGYRAFDGCDLVTLNVFADSYAHTYAINESINFSLISTQITTENGIVFETSTGTITAYIGSAETLIIPSTINGVAVTSIGASAFWDCTSLTSVTIPDSVTVIGELAFSECYSLTSITIPDNVTVIGDYAFSNCTSLTSITIPDSVTSIEFGMFYNCIALTSVTIPDSVISIGIAAFSWCTSLTGITIPDSVTSIGNSAFYRCTSLISITIPESVTSIGNDAFAYCESLTSITIPESVTSIGDKAFSSCTLLTSITIPNSVTSIGWAVFKNCTSLTSLFIPDGVTSIGYGAFEGCSSLTSVTIPNSVTSIDDSAFENCTSLTIYGYADSYAQTYATDNSIPFSIIEEPTFELNLVDQETKQFSIITNNIDANSTYQIWCEEFQPEGGNYWRLLKGYGEDFSTAIVDGTAAKTFIAEGEFLNIYKIYIRVKDISDAITPYSKQFSAKQAGIFKIDALEINEIVPIGKTILEAGSTSILNTFATKATENNNQIIFDYYFNNQLVQSSNGSQYTLTIPSDSEPGIQTVKVVAYQEGTPLNNDFIEIKIYVYNPTLTVPELTGDGFTLPSSIEMNVSTQLVMTNNVKDGTGANAEYKFQISEPMKIAFATLNSGDTSYSFLYPGVYQVFGSVRNTGANRYSDGAIKTIRINRLAGGGTPAVVGSVTIEKKSTELEEYSETTLNDVTREEYVKITAPVNANAQYSFYKLDASGNKEIKSWSSSNELLWRPMQSGNYRIQVRVRDIAFAGTSASYEDAKSLAFNIKNKLIDTTNTISNVTIETVGSEEKSPITVIADCTATNIDNVMYRFEVSDVLMGGQLIQEYSMSNSCTWVPRKAGAYTIRVLAKDAYSFGYYDAMTTETVTIS